MSKEHCYIDSIRYSCVEPAKATDSKMTGKSSSENVIAKMVDAQLRGVYL